MLLFFAEAASIWGSWSPRVLKVIPPPLPDQYRPSARNVSILNCPSPSPAAVAVAVIRYLRQFPLDPVRILIQRATNSASAAKYSQGVDQIRWFSERQMRRCRHHSPSDLWKSVPGLANGTANGFPQNRQSGRSIWAITAFLGRCINTEESRCPKCAPLLSGGMRRLVGLGGFHRQTAAR